MRLIAGAAFGETSPVRTFSPIFYLGVEAAAGARISLPGEYPERAVYLVSGEVSIDGVAAGPGVMAAFADGAAPEIIAHAPSRLMLLGGAPGGERIIWWNLVAAGQPAIDAAKADWSAAAADGFPQGGRFTLPPGESEFIPLPDA